MLKLKNHREKRKKKLQRPSLQAEDKNVFSVGQLDDITGA